MPTIQQGTQPSQLEALLNGFELEQDYDAYAEIACHLASGPTATFLEKIAGSKRVGDGRLADAWQFSRDQYSVHALDAVRRFAELGFQSRPIKNFGLSPENVQLALRQERFDVRNVSIEMAGPEWPVGWLDEIDTFVQDSLVTVASYAFSWGRTGSIEQLEDFNPVDATAAE